MTIRPWWLAGLTALLLVSAVCYALRTAEGRDLLAGLAVLRPVAPAVHREPLVPTPVPAQPATLYWVGRDGLWSLQEHLVAAALTDRIEQLSNLVLDRLGMDLLVVQTFVGEDDVAYLFFSVVRWEPTALEEVKLTQSLVRTLLSDLPWLSGVRLVLPQRHLDYRRPLQHFDLGFDPLIEKSHSTLPPEGSP